MSAVAPGTSAEGRADSVSRPERRRRGCGIDRRQFLALAPLGVLLAGCTTTPSPQRTAPGSARAPRALVYRGPAACRGCSEAVAALLRTSPAKFDVAYCGPDEELPLTAATLKPAAVYAQPGGGEVDPAWEIMRPHAKDIRDYVHAGGCYLGFCLGAYLAGSEPGYQLFPGDTDQYIRQEDATVRTSKDTIIAVDWRGKRRHLYFQDGPTFRLQPESEVTVLARYADTQYPAAIVTDSGQGRVGLVGPHPEADHSWYSEHQLHNPDGIRFDLGYDLITAACA